MFFFTLQMFYPYSKRSFRGASISFIFHLYFKKSFSFNLLNSFKRLSIFRFDCFSA